MSAENKHLYEFGPYRVDPDQRLLVRDNQSIPLQPKAFETLLVLIRNRQRVVLKEDLMKAIWPDSFVEEANLSQNIFVLRKALGEVGGRYIITIPGRGYRFVEAVKEISEVDADLVVESHSVQTVAVEESGLEHLKGLQSPTARPSGRWRWLVATALIGIVVAGGLLVVRRMLARPAMNEADLVLVSDFVNTTGEPIFDDSLKQATTLKLAESPYFNLAADSASRTTLQSMGRSPDERVVPPLSREVCEREGAKVLIGGSILALGNNYVLDLDATNCLTGELIAHQEIKALRKEEVLGKLGQLITPVRRKLGETISSIQEFDTPVEQATTKSLPALKAYAQGDQARAHGKEQESIAFYKMAIELDPDFSMAYARLGVVYGNLMQPVLADENKKKAFEKREHTTERERFYIQTHYYSAIGEPDKGIQILELWSQVYPHDWYPVSTLGNSYTALGDNDRAILAGQRALRLNPNYSLPYSVLANAYLNASRFAEAKTVCEQAVAAKLDRANVHSMLMGIALIEGDARSAQHERDWSAEHPKEDIVISAEAQYELSLGRLRQARSLYEQARERISQDGLPETVGYLWLREARYEVRLGFSREAREMTERALRVAPGAQIDAAITLAHAGDLRRAEVLGEELSREHPADQLVANLILPLVRAASNMSRNDPSAAVAELQKAIPYDLNASWAGETTYDRGYAYLQMKDGKEAAQQFQKLLDNRGATGFLWPLAHLGLARTYALSEETDKSRAAYKQFLELWKNADPDLPILKEAKAEYGRLSAQPRGALSSTH